ncbi:hypothetical protein GW756_06335, partial [bacterium]|nr:hypothetical protein [bacterium]
MNYKDCHTDRGRCVANYRASGIRGGMAEENTEFAVGHEGASHLSEWDSS